VQERVSVQSRAVEEIGAVRTQCGTVITRGAVAFQKTLPKLA
jgi:hypothetical protein